MDPDSSPTLALFTALQGLSPSLPELSYTSLGAQVGLFLVLLILSALFSGSEVALFSITASEREALQEEKAAASKRVLALLSKPKRLLVAILLLNTIVNVGAAILSAQFTLTIAAAMGWQEGLAVLIEVIILTFVLLVTSEIAPKLIASRQPAAFAKLTAGFLSPLVSFVSPLADALAKVAQGIQKRIRHADDTLSSEDIKTMADVGEAQGSLEEDERALIHSIVEFGETTVREVMVSRVDVTALPESASLDEALDLIRSSGHSRFPLYQDHLDNLLGVVYAKDLLPYLGHTNGVQIDWASIARKPLFVPPTKTLDDMLADFQRTNTHLAIAVDEYGGTAGLVTLEDLLEEVVGEIRDEFDQDNEAPSVREIQPGVFETEARIDLDDLAEALGVEMETNDFDFETLGGLILHLAGEIPAAGDEVTFERLRMRVEEMEENRIRQVVVEVLPADGSSTE